MQVEHFSTPQIVQGEGCYSGGRVTVCALPTELLGPDNLHTWPLRRLEGKVSEAELAEHVVRELGKVCVEQRNVTSIFSPDPPSPPSSLWLGL